MRPVRITFRMTNPPARSKRLERLVTSSGIRIVAAVLLAIGVGACAGSQTEESHKRSSPPPAAYSVAPTSGETHAPSSAAIPSDGRADAVANIGRAAAEAEAEADSDAGSSSGLGIDQSHYGDIAESDDASEEGEVDARASVGQRRADSSSVSPPAAAPQAYDREEVRRPPAPRDMGFTDAGVNPWQRTERDALSTFAVDVDTGSYPIARSYIQDGHLPPVEAVRAEEVLNYFDAAYDYAAPRRGTFAVHVDGAPSPFAPGETILRVGVKGKEIDERRRSPLALTLVIDVSGSMEGGGRLELLKDGLDEMLDELKDGDSLAIVAYSNSAWVALQRTDMGGREGPRAARRALRQLRPMESTNAEAGLVLGYDLADAGWREDAVNRVVLASDGVANVGATGPGTLLDRIGDSVRRDITLTAIGVGMGNYNDAILEQLADRGDGTYHYIDDLAEARRVLVDRLVATMQPIALDAKVQVAFEPEAVRAWRLVGYENRDVADRDFQNDNVDAGEIGAGQSATALYALELAPNARGRLATVRVRWQDPEGGETAEIEEEASLRDVAAEFDHGSNGLRLATAAAAFAELLRDGPWAKSARFEDVADIAFGIANDQDDADYDAVDELARLADEAGWLRDGVGYGGREGERRAHGSGGRRGDR